MSSSRQSAKKFKILFYTMNWYPFEGSIQPLYAALLRHLKRQGYEITILTSIPYFLNTRQERWEAYKGKFFITEWWEGIKAIRVFVLSPYFMRFFTIISRLISCMSFSVTSLFVSLFIGKYDVILTVSHPPLLIGIVSFIISRIKKCQFIYCLEDIYPDILVDLKILGRGWTISLLSKIELLIYNKARKICVLSQQMKDNLEKKGVNLNKVEIVPHFADLDKIVPLPKLNSLAKQYQLDPKFVVLLPGSMSYRYGIDNIFESARLLLGNEKISFVFIDRGQFRETFKQRAISERLENIHFLPFQPIDKFPQVLASADVCLVPLDKGFSSYSIPSKLYNIMASARPVIAIVDNSSEVAEIVKRAECGITILPKSPDLLAEEIKRLSNDRERCDTMGNNGRRFAEENFNKADICRKYEEIIYNMINVQCTKK